MEGRREKRNSARLQVLVSNLARPWLTEQVLTENITSYGMRVQTERPWEPGTIVLIKSFQDELRARARVVYCKPLQHKTFGLGLEFLARTGAGTRR
jgi:hypothetical protein